MSSKRGAPKCGPCTACCQWNGDINLHVRLTPDDVALGVPGIPTGDGDVVLPAQENGDCMYLDRENGCTIYHLRPEACRKYDCRDVLDMIMADDNNVLLRIMAAAITLEIAEGKKDGLV